MKKLFNLLFFIGLTCAAQKDLMSCEKGSQRAMREFNKKQYSLHVFGDAVDKDFDPVFTAYAKERYKIRLLRSSDMVMPETKCYEQTMRAKMLKKFGDNIEEKMRAEALAVFKKTDKYITEIKPKIDTGFVFNPTHTQADFKGGNTALRSFLCNNIKDTQREYWTTYVTFIVEKDGSISHLEFTKEPPSTEIKSEVERLFSIMDKWTPATYYRENVRSRLSHSVSSRKNMEMMEDIRRKQDAEWKAKMLHKKRPKSKNKK